MADWAPSRLATARDAHAFFRPATFTTNLAAPAESRPSSSVEVEAKSIVVSNSDVEHGSPENHPVGLGMDLSKTSVGVEDFNGLTNNGWQTVATDPPDAAIPSGPTGPMGEASVGQGEMPDQRQDDDASVGSESVGTVRPDTPSLKTNTVAGGVAVSASGSQQEQKIGRGEENVFVQSGYVPPHLWHTITRPVGLNVPESPRDQGQQLEVQVTSTEELPLPLLLPSDHQNKHSVSQPLDHNQAKPQIRVTPASVTEADNVEDSNNNNSDEMGYGNRNSSGPTRGAAAFLSSRRGRGGYVQRNAWTPPHLRKESLNANPAEGKVATLFTYENSGIPLEGAGLTDSDSNQSGHSQWANVSKPSGTDHEAVGSSSNGLNWDTQATASPNHMVYRGPKQNEKDQSKPNRPSRANRWGKKVDKADAKPSQIAPLETSQEVSGRNSGSVMSNQTVRSCDVNRQNNGDWETSQSGWEERPTWKDRHMQEHLVHWAKTSVVTEAPDIKNPDFQSGAGTVDGQALVAPPEEEDTLPNPERSEKAGQTSNSSMLIKRIKFLERQLAQKDAEIAHAKSMNPNVYAPDVVENPHAPDADIYLRHAVLADLPACKEIYNHYTTNSVVVPEGKPITEEKIREHYRDVRQRLNLPWIVAVLRGPEANGYESAGHDHIVGFAFADDFNGLEDMYQFTAEIQVFVHHQQLRHGVGKCLTDRLLHYLDPGYNPRGGYDFIDDEDDLWGPGGKRDIASVLCNIAYKKENGSHDEMKWRRRWLEAFEFDDAGYLKKVGRKFNEWVNVVQMQKETLCTIPAYWD
ncbi:MAG: hypothetical protein M1816_001579 [Peltula sp. TS41687]|nr:MAG: hypothetical protein M1816_001579 [Peltula sp. TS41687]